MKKHKSRIGLKWKLFGHFAIFTAVLLTVIWVCETLLLGTIYRQIKTDSLEKCVAQITRTIKNDGYAQELDSIAQSYDVSIKIVDKNYSTLYHYYSGPTNMVERISPAELFILCEKADAGGGAYVQVYQQYMLEERLARLERYKNKQQNFYDKATGDTEQTQSEYYEEFRRGEPPRFFSKDMLLNLISTSTGTTYDGTDCYIIVDSVITPVEATVKTLVIMLLYISAFTLIIALIIAFILARRVANPIVKMNNSAKRLAKGDYNTKFESRGYAEIEQLNETMNYAARELSKADELRRELLANVSHDLRTPLTMIIGYSEVMRDIPGENSPENIQVVIDEATRLSGLVNDLLDISKLQAGDGKLSKERYCITDSIKEIIKRFDKLSDKDGYRVDFEYDRDVYINADKSRLSQVVYNLIINAINYTGENKDVRVIQKTTSGNKVRIEVCDNGQGISREDLPYIWDRYYRVDKTHKRVQMGTGLGLSIVKSVLESHNAVYGVDSTLGVGSRFWFELDITK